MGACDISFKLNKKASMSEIRAAFEKQQEENQSENGHRDGYSGDFNTVERVDDHTDKVFDSEREAQDYCLKTAEKWTSVVAVYFRSARVEPSKAMKKIAKKMGELVVQMEKLERERPKLRKFVTCEGCASKISTAHMRGVKCPVCNEGDFRPLGLLRKIRNAQTKIDLLREKYNGIHTALRTKQVAKLGDKCLQTLVCGWGAC